MFDNSFSSNLAIIIPTKNRSFWVDRILKYYSAVNFIGNLIIVDSSDSNIDEHEIYSMKYSNLTLIYRPGLSTHEAIEVGLNSLSSKIRYVIQTGDDDFICMDILEKLINFLETNSDFSAAYGDAFVVGLHRNPNNKLKISWCSKYWNGYSIESNDLLARSQELLSNYLNLEFAVRRRETVLAGINAINSSVGRKDFDESTTLEILAAIDTAMTGKVSYMKGNYLIRGDHIDRPNRYGRTIIRQYIGTNKFTELKTYIQSKLSENGVIISKDLENNINDILNTYVEKSILNRARNEHVRINLSKLIKYFWRKIKGVYFKRNLRRHLQLIKN